MFETVSLIYDENDNVPKLSDIRVLFLDSIITHIKSYFPNADLKLFKIFIPKELPSDIGVAITYGVVEINRICNMFKMADCLQLVSDWANLLIPVIDSDDYCTYKTSKVETYLFWSQYLNKEGIAWTEKTTKLIRTILVIPIGSAEAERGFSIFNHIKTSRKI